MAKAYNKQPLGRGLSALLENPSDDIRSIEDKNADKIVGNIIELPIAQINLNPFQPRTNFENEKILELAQSIKEENQNEMNFSEIYKNNQNLEYVAEANSALIGSFESIGKSNFIVGALSNAKEGDIIGPLPTIRGEAFVKVIDIADVVMSDFEEKKDAIKFSLLIDRQNAIWGNWLQALRDNADLKDYRYDFY